MCKKSHQNTFASQPKRIIQNPKLKNGSNYLAWKGKLALF